MTLEAASEAAGAKTFRASAEAYDRHIGRYGPALAAALISASDLRPGQSAPDVRAEEAVAEALPLPDSSFDVAYDGFDDLWQPLEAASGPRGRTLPHFPPDPNARGSVTSCGTGSRPAKAASGSARAWCVAGRVPAGAGRDTGLPQAWPGAAGQE